MIKKKQCLFLFTILAWISWSWYSDRDQRITQDGERLCKSFSEIIAKLLISPFVICYYTYITWKRLVMCSACKYLVVKSNCLNLLAKKFCYWLMHNICSIICFSTGYIGPVSVVIFFIISTVINKFLMSPVVALVYKQEQLEGDFR